MIPVYQPYLTGREAYYVNQCLDSTWISSRGEFIGRFEEAFSRYVGCEHSTTVCNGTVALHLALISLGIGPGDEVIVPTLTYVASVNAIKQAGATPIFVDSVLATWQIDTDDVIRKISPRTKAILVVHLYGLPCDMPALQKICCSRGLLLIEDCAEAFGTLYKRQHVGTFGDAATFSFFGNKTITTGEGGMVVFREKKYFSAACHLKNQGVSKDREYWHDVLGYNYRMTNISAAIGLAQLEYADEIIDKKRKIASWYQTWLKDLPVIFHSEQPDTRHSFWMCSILTIDSLAREPLRKWLGREGIETRPVFFPSHQLPHLRTEGSFPNAEYISLRGINLPSSPKLSRAEVELICGVIQSYFDGRNL